jgi:hypothetical protein
LITLLGCSLGDDLATNFILNAISFFDNDALVARENIAIRIDVECLAFRNPVGV